MWNLLTQLTMSKPKSKTKKEFLLTNRGLSSQENSLKTDELFLTITSKKNQLFILYSDSEVVVRVHAKLKPLLQSLLESTDVTRWSAENAMLDFPQKLTIAERENAVTILISEQRKSWKADRTRDCLLNQYLSIKEFTQFFFSVISILSIKFFIIVGSILYFSIINQVLAIWQ